jgi:hypothetical protein
MSHIGTSLLFAACRMLEQEQHVGFSMWAAQMYHNSERCDPSLRTNAKPANLRTSQKEILAALAIW